MKYNTLTSKPRNFHIKPISVDVQLSHNACMYPTAHAQVITKKWRETSLVVEGQGSYVF